VSEKIVRHIEIAYDSTHYLGWILSRRDLSIPTRIILDG